MSILLQVLCVEMGNRVIGKLELNLEQRRSAARVLFDRFLHNASSAENRDGGSCV